jgi:hypothetical protein
MITLIYVLLALVLLVVVLLLLLGIAHPINQPNTILDLPLHYSVLLHVHVLHRLMKLWHHHNACLP